VVLVSITEHVDDRYEDGRYTDASNPRMVTYIDPITGYVSHYEILPAVFDEPCTFTITFTQEEPMIPTRREVWAEIKDRIDVCQNVARPPYTMVEVGTVYNGHLYSGFGFAKQNRYGPTADEWNEKEGFNHAYGRAKQNLLDTIMASLKGAA
jgi:hypothetical protein